MKKSLTEVVAEAVGVPPSPAVLESVDKSFTKDEMLGDIAGAVNLPKKKVAEVMSRLQVIISAHVKSALPFSLLGLLKIDVVDKPATEDREGVNPFTGEPTVFKGKPAHKAVKVKPLQKLKAMTEH